MCTSPRMPPNTPTLFQKRSGKPHGGVHGRWLTNAVDVTSQYPSGHKTPCQEQEHPHLATTVVEIVIIAVIIAVGRPARNVSERLRRRVGPRSLPPPPPLLLHDLLPQGLDELCSTNRHHNTQKQGLSCFRTGVRGRAMWSNATTRKGTSAPGPTRRRQHRKTLGRPAALRGWTLSQH